MAREPSILVIVPYFGPWPEWMPFFLLSCRHNPTVNWLVVSDRSALPATAPNVRLLQTPFPEYKAAFERCLGIDLPWDEPYKLCDLKPMLGLLHGDAVRGFDFWGYGDLDLVYGDIRRIYGEAVLRHDVVSSHDWLVAGHFSLFRNRPRWINAFRHVRGWQTAIRDPSYRSVDESGMAALLLPSGAWARRFRFLSSWRRNTYFVEQYTTALPPNRWIDGSPDFPDTWYWRRGRLTADKAPGREFLYVHFSHWHSARWLRGAAPPWRRERSIVHLPIEPMPDAFKMDSRGFHPL